MNRRSPSKVNPLTAWWVSCEPPKDARTSHGNGKGSRNSNKRSRRRWKYLFSRDKSNNEMEFIFNSPLFVISSSHLDGEEEQESGTGGIRRGFRFPFCHSYYLFHFPSLSSSPLILCVCSDDDHHRGRVDPSCKGPSAGISDQDFLSESPS